MAKRARMSAVKRLANRLAQRRALRVINDHRCPRQRLESDPMQPDRATKRKNCGNPADATKHDCEASDPAVTVNYSVSAEQKRHCLHQDIRSSRHERFEAIVARFLPGNL